MVIKMEGYSLGLKNKGGSRRRGLDEQEHDGS